MLSGYAPELEEDCGSALVIPSLCEQESHLEVRIRRRGTKPDAFPRGGIVTLSEISVRGLFGQFDHQIVLNEDECVTIMIAPNGFGKTTILRIVNCLFNRQLRRLAAISFRRLSVRFDNGWNLTVARRLPPKGAAKKSGPQLKVTLDTGARSEKSFTVPEFSFETISFRIGMIEEWIPALDRVGPQSWVNLETGDRLGLEEVVELYGHEFPVDVQSKLGIPEWFNDLQRQVSVRFIEVERLTSSRFRRRSRSTQRTVNLYSQELGEKIQQTLAEYGALSQSLDRTFPSRLVDQPLQSALTMDQLRGELRGVEDKRAQLVAAGLLQQEHTGLSAPASDIEDVDESRREVLAMFARDSKEKLGVFDDMLARVETLKRIANSRFLHKQVTVSEQGIVVVTSDGTPLNLEMLSSGEQHELVLLYGLLFRVSRGTVVMIDEPELSLHVAWQEKFISDIVDVASLSSFRVVLATHSPQIIGDRYDLTIELRGPVDATATTAGSNR